MSHNGNSAKNLTGLLDDIESVVKGRNISLGDIVGHFKSRGFGPLLLIPALLLILPTGAIPMVPSLCGLLIGFVCLQMLIGREHPWIPPYIQNFSIPRKTLVNAIKRAKPYTSRIDYVVHKRLEILIGPVSKRLTALICLVLCGFVIVIGFIPMLPAILAVPIMLFGLGYIAQDGLLVAIGFLAAFGSAFALYSFFGG